MLSLQYSVVANIALTSTTKDFEEKFPGSINLKRTKVGFMSPLDKPRIKNPTYQQVCSGQSGHVEVLYVELNEPEKYFEELIRFFFTFHDPTTLNRQGNDRGFQYASYIFVGDEHQLEIAEKVKGELQSFIDERKVTRFAGMTVTTKIGPIKEFTEAKAEHQEYLAKNPNGYCNHFISEFPLPHRRFHLARTN
jgi:peptide-methionine (S)-S-oxide reductase